MDVDSLGEPVASALPPDGLIRFAAVTSVAELRELGETGLDLRLDDETTFLVVVQDGEWTSEELGIRRAPVEDGDARRHEPFAIGHVAYYFDWPSLDFSTIRMAPPGCIRH